MKTRNKMSVWGLIVMLTALLIGVGCSSDSNPGTPNANAGADQKVLIGDNVTLDGSASTGVTFAKWTIVSKPSSSSAALSSDGALQPTFVADVAGDYTFQLTINDNASTDSATITAKSIIAKIGNGSGSSIATRTRFGLQEYAINLNQAGGILDGSGSRGNVSTYQWEEVSGPGATVASAGATTLVRGSSIRSVSATNESTLSFTAPGFAQFMSESDKYKWQTLPISRSDLVLLFKLTVSDGNGNSDTATFPVYLADEGAEFVNTTGLPNVPINVPVVLQGPSLKANSTTPSTEVTNWTWTMTPPAGSSATFADSGTTTSSIQFPRFTPDVAGIYSIAYSSAAPTAMAGNLKVTAATYVGQGGVGGATATNPQCGTCHNGTIGEDINSKWKETKHAKLFESNYGSFKGLAPEPFFWGFSTVGYNMSAVNGGFDDLVTSTGFDITSSKAQTYADFTKNFSSLAQLSGIQCENCHGPGSAHSGDPIRISLSVSQYAVCGQCHQEEAQWVNSAHNSTGVAHGAGRYQGTWVTSAGCTRCHTGKGFDTYLREGEEGLTPITETGGFVGIQCAGCHDPHDATNPNQLRVHGNVTMVVDGSTVNAGKAAVCYTCHDGLYSYGEADCDKDRNPATSNNVNCASVEETADFYFRQVHYNPQAPVLEGKGAIRDLDGDGNGDFTLTENSFHSSSGFTLAGATGNASLATENNKCVTCHMASPPSADQEGYGHVGGHSFAVRSGHSIGHLKGEETEEEAGEHSTAGSLEYINACTPCHISLTTFNRTARADYDGDGTTKGIQDEVKGLLLLVSNAIKTYDTTNVGPCNTGGAAFNAGSCTGSTTKTCSGAPGFSCTVAADCTAGVFKCTLDDTDLCRTDADCIVNRAATTSSGTFDWGTCNTTTSKCTNTLGTTSTSCTADSDCGIIPNAFGFATGNKSQLNSAQGSYYGFNRLGGDAGTCVLVGAALKCNNDRSKTCAVDADCNKLDKAVGGTDQTRGTILRRAIWNHNMLAREASLGIHNAAFSVQVLQKTYMEIMKKVNGTLCTSSKCNLSQIACTSAAGCYEKAGWTLR